MVIIYIVLGLIGLMVIAGLIFGIQDYIQGKKYLPLNSTTIEGNQREYLIRKIRLTIKHLGEQQFTLSTKISDVKEKGYTESEAIELLGIKDVEDSIKALVAFEEKLKCNEQIVQMEIDKVNKILSGMKLRLNIIDPVTLLPKKKAHR